MAETNPETVIQLEELRHDPTATVSDRAQTIERNIENQRSQDIIGIDAQISERGNLLGVNSSETPRDQEDGGTEGEVCNISNCFTSHLRKKKPTLFWVVIVTLVCLTTAGITAAVCINLRGNSTDLSKTIPNDITEVGLFLDTDQLLLITDLNIVVAENDLNQPESQPPHKLIIHVSNGTEESKLSCNKCSFESTNQIVKTSLNLGDIFCAELTDHGNALTSHITMGSKKFNLQLRGSSESPIRLYYIRIGNYENTLPSLPILISWNRSDNCWA